MKKHFKRKWQKLSGRCCALFKSASPYFLRAQLAPLNVGLLYATFHRLLLLPPSFPISLEGPTPYFPLGGTTKNKKQLGGCRAASPDLFARKKERAIRNKSLTRKRRRCVECLAGLCPPGRLDALFVVFHTHSASEVQALTKQVAWTSQCGSTQEPSACEPQLEHIYIYIINIAYWYIDWERAPVLPV